LGKGLRLGEGRPPEGALPRKEGPEPLGGEEEDPREDQAVGDGLVVPLAPEEEGKEVLEPVLEAREEGGSQDHPGDRPHPARHRHHQVLDGGLQGEGGGVHEAEEVGVEEPRKPRDPSREEEGLEAEGRRVHPEACRGEGVPPKGEEGPAQAAFPEVMEGEDEEGEEEEAQEGVAEGAVQGKAPKA